MPRQPSREPRPRKPAHPPTDPNRPSPLTDGARWVQANPRTASALVTSAVALAFPAAISAPILGALGFGAGGIVAGKFLLVPSPLRFLTFHPKGSFAAWLHSLVGNAAAGGAFAVLQSAGMAGYGAVVVNGAVQIAGGLGVVIAAAVGRVAGGMAAVFRGWLGRWTWWTGD
ncbi:hypothetical protein QBC33DRAFT_120791 [Phialemonium atrogriseum]|uniref:Uncharacterized protein n=1 Tax=Phialemonium atrogriseum TaxID=1093897 RepID=A0AAJ0C1F4_9PEZI|nr:uncharacterized protein QBC33DRAFT_120791 [Phialemonium atrogriseum]KAK1765936.1 hypothetical protein QBC33DRAFT_120791 [Phialemonium atrogriseum]